jgi:Asp-tRNA(Asn)/Glu-tRNA(Gln) amidotransferase B subunit
LIEDQGLAQVTDDSAIVLPAEDVDANPNEVAAYKAGKET